MFFSDDGPPISVTVAGACQRHCRRWLYPDAPYREQHFPRARTFDSLWDFCQQRRPAWVLLHRTHALGDIVMLVPILAAMHRVLDLANPMLIAVGQHLLPQLGTINALEWRVGFVRSKGANEDYGADVHMDLNHVLEVDHRGGAASDRHRMDLYADYLGISLETEEQPC